VYCAAVIAVTEVVLVAVLQIGRPVADHPVHQLEVVEISRQDRIVTGELTKAADNHHRNRADLTHGVARH
jgi:hypothetical protein